MHSARLMYKDVKTNDHMICCQQCESTHFEEIAGDNITLRCEDCQSVMQPFLDMDEMSINNYRTDRYIVGDFYCSRCNIPYDLDWSQIKSIQRIIATCRVCGYSRQLSYGIRIVKI